jgi:hypothetical protein
MVVRFSGGDNAGHTVINPYGEFAVEAALKVKDAKGGKVTALSLGIGLQREVVKKPLSMGCDDLILLEEPAFDGGDSWATAYALAMAAAAHPRIDTDDMLVLDGKREFLGFGVKNFIFGRQGLPIRGINRIFTAFYCRVLVSHRKIY